MAAPRTSALARRFHALDRGLRPGFTRALRRFFAAQSTRVLVRYLGLYALFEAVFPQPKPEELLPDLEKQVLWMAMLPFLLQASLNSGAVAGDLVGLEELTEADPRVAELLSEAGIRIAGIHRTTLEAIRATLADGASAGYSVAQIAYGVPEDGFRGLSAVVNEVYKGRAETIARTELARCTNLAALERYSEAGAAEVYVIDGTAPTPCGWLFHDDEDKANDTWRTVIDARQHPLAHPNCRRRFIGPRPGRNRVPQLPPVVALPPRPQRLRITVEIQRRPR